jgi:Zn-dependent protease with chaperone function
MSADSDPVSVAARLLDCETAAVRAVQARFEPGAVVIDATDGTVTRWEAAAVRLAERRMAGVPLRLTGGVGKAVLIVEGPQAEAWIAQHRIRSARSAGGRRLAWVAVTILLVTGAFAAVWATVGPALLTALVPASWERAIGDDMAEFVIDWFAAKDEDGPRFCAEPAGLAALDRLVARLNAAAPARLDVRVSVVRSRTVNALALPGGRILVLSRLIERAKTPDELAGVLAHEIGHVAHRHGLENVIRYLGLGTLVDLVLGGSGSVVSVAAVQAMNSAYSREAEREADAAGVALLNRAGMSGEGLVAFFDRVSKKDRDGSIMALFSSHPMGDERAAAVRAAARPGGGPAMSAADWRALRAICGSKKN